MAGSIREIDAVHPTGISLGKGSYGEVLEVEWCSTLCAAKKMHEIFLTLSRAEVDKMVRDFTKEYHVWSNLRHPNIVQLLGVHYPPDRLVPVFILEKMDTSLRFYLEDHTKEEFLVLDKMSILRQVAQGLCYLHDHDPPLVHHDLSPNNILLNKWTFLAKLTDFGMTRAINQSKLTRRSSVKGTTAFMSPEALQVPPRYTEKLDVFSFGNCIATILTHEWPNPTYATSFINGKLMAFTEFQRRQNQIDLLNTKEKELFLSLIKSCLEDDPSIRPTSANLVSAMKRIQSVLLQTEESAITQLKQAASQCTAERQQNTHLQELLDEKLIKLEGKQAEINQLQVFASNLNELLSSQVEHKSKEIDRLKLKLAEERLQHKSEIFKYQEAIESQKEANASLQKDNLQLLTDIKTLETEYAKLYREAQLQLQKDAFNNIWPIMIDRFRSVKASKELLDISTDQPKDAIDEDQEHDEQIVGSNEYSENASKKYSKDEGISETVAIQDDINLQAAAVDKQPVISVQSNLKSSAPNTVEQDLMFAMELDPKQGTSNAPSNIKLAKDETICETKYHANAESKETAPVQLADLDQETLSSQANLSEAHIAKSDSNTSDSVVNTPESRDQQKVSLDEGSTDAAEEDQNKCCHQENQTFDLTNIQEDKSPTLQKEGPSVNQTPRPIKHPPPVRTKPKKRYISKLSHHETQILDSTEDESPTLQKEGSSVIQTPIKHPPPVRTKPKKRNVSPTPQSVMPAALADEKRLDGKSADNSEQDEEKFPFCDKCGKRFSWKERHLMWKHRTECDAGDRSRSFSETYPGNGNLGAHSTKASTLPGKYV